MSYLALKKLKAKAKRFIVDEKSRIKSSGKVKYFCIGRNKTGTTSLKVAFGDLGFSVGNQRKAEILAGKYYFKGVYQPIIKYCESAQVFQDVPFSYPETYKVIDQAYPGSKFILTVRDTSEQWYSSITRFHSKLYGKNGRLPTSEDLRAAEYVWKGYAYNIINVYGTTDDDPYNKETMIAHYERYNREVIEYFKDRSNDLLVINVAEKGAYQKFVEFLGVDSPYDDFPWENKT